MLCKARIGCVGFHLLQSPRDERSDKCHRADERRELAPQILEPHKLVYGDDLRRDGDDTPRTGRADSARTSLRR